MEVDLTRFSDWLCKEKVRGRAGLWEKILNSVLNDKIDLLCRILCSLLDLLILSLEKNLV